MPTIHWKLADGQTISAEVMPGMNLMQGATNAAVPGIDGECGGCLSCATCHVYVDDAWIDRTGSAGDNESAMLDIVTAPRKATSRLSCQITASAALDGLVVHVPAQ